MAKDEVGLTKDVGYQIGVRRTVPYPLEVVWELLRGPAGLATWLGPGVTLRPEKGTQYVAEDGTRGEVRSFRTHDRIRLTYRPAGWSHETTIQVALVPAATGTAVIFHQEHLADSEERSRQRDHWRRVADEFVELFDAAEAR